jgi:hypothetical protein
MTSPWRRAGWRSRRICGWRSAGSLTGCERNPATIQSSPFREEIEREWKNMPGHQLPEPLPPFTSCPGVNRLRVEVDYRAENGRQGPRRVEPYSLRRTRDGNLVLFVVNDRGQLRSYLIDRMAGIRPTTETFTPRYQVEF